MTYKAPHELAASHPIPQVIPLIEANVQRFETELRSGYQQLMHKAQLENIAVNPFDVWAFMLLDQVFSDMLEAEADHTSPHSYTEEIGRRLRMKIKWAIKNATQTS